MISMPSNLYAKIHLYLTRQVLSVVHRFQLSFISAEILCTKLKIYGFDEKSCNWFNSFLTGRSQQVKIGRTLSGKWMLESGVPQGGILSPIIFVIYGSDMELWLKYSLFNFLLKNWSQPLSTNQESIMYLIYLHMSIIQMSF